MSAQLPLPTMEFPMTALNIVKWNKRVLFNMIQYPRP